MFKQALMSAFVVMAASDLALAQFGTPGTTNVREKITGKLLSAAGAPTPAAQDQIGAFFNNQLAGAFTFTGTSTDFSITIFGDSPSTANTVEGPKAGQPVEFRFFDVSSNQTISGLRVETVQGEAFNYTYGGELVEIPDGLPFPIDLTPNRNLNLRIGASGGNGGGNEDPKDKYDVDANGVVDEMDAAMVLRAVIGARRSLSDDELARIDVNEDERVDTADAIEILRNR